MSYSSKRHFIVYPCCFVLLFSTLLPIFGIDDNDMKLIDQYVLSMGADTVVFDANNIKQFWTDKTVSSKDHAINIQLSNHKSVPLNIQLAHVLETYDCKVDIISGTPDIGLSILNKRKDLISGSTTSSDFLHYKLFSNSFHLDQTEDFSFLLQFSSNSSSITIYKIVLSFTLNADSPFKGSPGFEQLLKDFDTNGIDIPNSNVKYLLSSDNSKIYFRIPPDLTSIARFFYHIYPTEKDMLKPDRVQYGYNNLDFNIKHGTNIIPKPFLSTSDFMIIQCAIPYDYTVLRIGQYKDKKRVWTLELKK